MFQQIDGLVKAFEQGRLSRRDLIQRIGAFVAVVSTGRVLGSEPKSTDAPPAVGKPTFAARGLNHIALNVTDIPRSRDFYQKHLGLSVLRESDRSCFMRTGGHFLAMFKGKSAGLDHYCYTIDDYDPGEAVETLKKADLSPVRHGNRVYFDDPDGIQLQVSAANEWDEWD